MEGRLGARGVAKGTSLDIAAWTVPTGILGARVYHLVTSPQDYFGPDGDPMRAFAIREGGLSIWGAVAGGALGAYIAARRTGLPLSFVADALAPGLRVAQAIGRLGNWFNNDVYGRLRASVVAVRTDGEHATLRYEVAGSVRAPSATRMTADEPRAEALDE